MPVTSGSVFPYTPGYVHGEQFGYAVQVHKFQDLTEQRYLLSRQQSLRLTYEYPYPSSSLIAGVRSWFMDTNGPQQPFIVTDHRDGSTHLARFASNQQDHFRGPHIRRNLTVSFVTLTAGTAPVATAFTTSAGDAFCEPVIQSSGTVAANSGIDPFSGTIIGSGNSILAYSGADWHFWRQPSHGTFDAWYVLGTAGGDLSGTLNVTNGDLLTVPFICTRSGATVGEIGVFARTAGGAGSFGRIGIYTQRSSATVDIFPQSLWLDAGCVGLAAAGLQTTTTSFQVKDDTLYYASWVESSSVILNPGAPAARRLSIGARLDATNIVEMYGWQLLNLNQIIAPSPFPGSATMQSQNAPGIYVKYIR